MKKNKKNSKNKSYGRGRKNIDRFTARSAVKRGSKARMAQARRHMSDESVVDGVFSSARSGYGFVRPTVDGWNGDDIFIPARFSSGALNGDRVRVRYRKYRDRDGTERTEGRITEVLEAVNKTVIGTLIEGGSLRRFRGGHHFGRGKLFLVPDDTKLNITPEITDDCGGVPGDKVEVELYGSKGHSGIFGKVIRVFGPSDSRGANYEAILAECGVTVDFTEEELREAALSASRPVTDDGRTVRDRDVIFTIDGEDAKDLDDAISLRRLEGGKWLLGVHIADVSYYVEPGTALDRAAMSRGTSIYFTDKVVPMLPPSLSNGACSLNAGEKKYALSALITLSDDGRIEKCKVEQSVIKSRVRGVYSEVNDLFEHGKNSEFYQKYREVYPTLMKMHELYLILKKRSAERGALELESSEAKILLGEDGEPTDIIRRTRGDGEMMIEQFMLAANEGVATLLHSKQIPCVYRIHETPPEEKLKEFVTFAHNLGFDTSFIRADTALAKGFGKLLDAAREKGIAGAVSYTLLRTMSKAKYSEVPSPHFGLGIPLYCHFTSPIRRLSDLATHRIIHKVLLGGESPKRYEDYARRAAAAASETELVALSAERNIEALYKTIYMSGFIGEIFDAVVSSVASFGLFAELENTCEGLVPIEDMNGYFIYDEKNYALRSGDKLYRLGDAVRVRLEEADISRARLRFSIVG